MVPGITSGQGAKLLKMGPNGKPHVEFKTVEAQALFDKWYREHLAKPQGGGAPVGPSSQPGAGGGVPEFLPLDKNTKADEATYPGIESAPNGYLPYLQQDEKGHLARDAQGRPMIRNPAHPNTQKLIKETSNHLASSRKKWDELRAAQGKATAEDGN
jgi:hypothetical protein